MANTFYPAVGARRGVILLMGLGLLFMLCVVFVQRFTGPGLVTDLTQQQQQGGAQQGGMGGMGGMGGELGKLMQQVNENPNDFKTLMHLAEHLVNDQQWDAAETFARRASTVNPQESQPQYLMGIILHNQGRHIEAAQALENVVKMKDDASVRYSLGVLYLHYLNNISKGVEHLSTALNDPKTSEAMKTSLREELEKIPMPGAHKEAAKEAAKEAPKEKGKTPAKDTGKEKPKAK